jgi:GT2 family glycosyltransferase
MKYSIIVPVFNQLDFTKICVDSIIEMSKDYDYEIIIVSNGSTDGTIEYLEKNKLIFLAYPNPLGYGEAINRGVCVSRGEYLIFLNNDTKILGPNWIKLLVQPFLEDPKVGITGPLMSWSPDVQSRFLIFFCVMVPRTIINEIGLLDSETFGVGFGEDIDYCMKVKKAGYRVVQVPESSLVNLKDGTNVGVFPIWHKAEGTCGDPNLVPNWNDIVLRNKETLRKRYIG